MLLLDSARSHLIGIFVFFSWSSLCLSARASFFFSTGGSCAAKQCDASQKGKVASPSVSKALVRPKAALKSKCPLCCVPFCCVPYTSLTKKWCLLSVVCGQINRNNSFWEEFYFNQSHRGATENSCSFLVWQWLSCSKYTVRQSAKNHCLDSVKLNPFFCYPQRLLPIDGANDLFYQPPPSLPTSKIYTIRPYFPKDEVRYWWIFSFCKYNI